MALAGQRVHTSSITLLSKGLMCQSALFVAVPGCMLRHCRGLASGSFKKSHRMGTNGTS